MRCRLPIDGSHYLPAPQPCALSWPMCEHVDDRQWWCVGQRHPEATTGPTCRTRRVIFEGPETSLRDEKNGMRVTSTVENFVQRRNRQFIRAQQPASGSLQDREGPLVHRICEARTVGKVRYQVLRPSGAQECTGSTRPRI